MLFVSMKEGSWEKGVGRRNWGLPERRLLAACSRGLKRSGSGRCFPITALVGTMGHVVGRINPTSTFNNKLSRSQHRNSDIDSATGPSLTLPSYQTFNLDPSELRCIDLVHSIESKDCPHICRYARMLRQPVNRQSVVHSFGTPCAS